MPLNQEQKGFFSPSSSGWSLWFLYSAKLGGTNFNDSLPPVSATFIVSLPTPKGSLAVKENFQGLVELQWEEDNMLKSGALPLLRKDYRIQPIVQLLTGFVHMF